MLAVFLRVKHTTHGSSLVVHLHNAFFCPPESDIWLLSCSLPVSSLIFPSWESDVDKDDECFLFSCEDLEFFLPLWKTVVIFCLWWSQSWLGLTESLANSSLCGWELSDTLELKQTVERVSVLTPSPVSFPLDGNQSGLTLQQPPQFLWNGGFFSKHCSHCHLSWEVKKNYI